MNNYDRGDIYDKVCQTVNGSKLNWATLASVTTDGAPCMVGSNRGVIARINQEMNAVWIFVWAKC